MNSTRRTAVFASYSKDNKIHDYVIYYLKELKKVCDNIIFVSDNEIEEKEQEKIRDIVCHAICHKHGEYDFGSYKRGFLWAEENNILNTTDELVLCNDSCYGPVSPFLQMFSAMQEKDCDFWGVTESHEYKTHLQSFFLVFKSNVFSSLAFHDYILNIEKKENVLDVIFSYEINDTEALEKRGFKHATYIDYNTLAKAIDHDTFNPVLFPNTLSLLGMPLIKRKTFVYGYEQSMQESTIELLNQLARTNDTLYNIICEDISSLYDSIGDIPQNAITDNAFIIEKLCDGKTALKAMYKMVEEVIEKRPHILGIHPTVIIQNNTKEIQEELDKIHKKNSKHLRQIRMLIALSSMLALCLIVSLLFNMI